VEVSLWFDRMDAPVESIESETDSTDAALLGRADRTRFFRVMGAPRVDALARRAILDEETPWSGA
jgi:hypothetical protein